MADGAHTEQMILQGMVQRLKEMNAQQAELKGEIGDMLSEMKADLLGVLKQALKLPEQTTVTNPNPSVETMTNPEPIVETAKNLDSFIEPLKRASVLQVPDSFSDVFLVHRVDSHAKEVEELPQESTNSNEKDVAHQVFDEMPLAVTSKEKQRKSLKAWKFKFKISFKRSKLMDDMFSFVEETAWLNRDPMETIWDYVKKEFKEVVTGCGKKITDRSKLVDETLKPAVYDGTVQIRVWDCGGSLLECVLWSRLKHYQRYGHEMQAIEAENKSPQTLGDHPFVPMKPYQSHAQPCLKCEAKMNISLAKETQDWTVNALFKTQVFSDFDIASWIGLEIYFCCETKRHMLLRVKLANRVWERGKLLATHLYWELFGLNPLVGLEIYSWECKKQLKSEKSPFQCTYAAQIKRCGETARQIFPLTDQMSKTGVLAKQMLMKECDIALDNVEAESPLLQEEKSTDSTKQIIIWIIFKALCSAGYEWENETIKERFIEMSKLEKDHELLSPENLDVHILSLFRKGGFIEFNGCHTHLKKLRAALERLPQEVSEELAKRIVIGKCLELLSKNHKLLHYEAEFCAHYNDLELLSTEHQSSLGLNFFTYSIFKWNQALNYGCEAGHTSSGFLSVGDVNFHLKHKWRSRLLQTLSRLEFGVLQTGDETQEKRLLLLNNNNKVDHTIKENWFHSEPMIRGVYHLQRPPEMIELQGNLDFITKVLVHWKEHPPDHFFSGSQWREFNVIILEDKDVSKREVL